MELWKPVTVPGFEHLYDVSDAGRVRRSAQNRLPGRILNGTDDKDGYRWTKLSLGTKATTRAFKIHRLVALAFIPNPEGKPEVNHIDTNKHNNAASNLEWATNEENNAHAKAHGLIRYRGPSGWHKLTEEQVKEVRLLFAGPRRGRNKAAAELAVCFGVTLKTIYNVVNGQVDCYRKKEEKIAA